MKKQFSLFTFVAVLTGIQHTTYAMHNPEDTQHVAQDPKKLANIRTPIKLVFILHSMVARLAQEDNNKEITDWVNSTRQNVSALFNGKFAYAFRQNAGEVSILSKAHEMSAVSVTDRDMQILLEAHQSGKELSEQLKIYE
jgi:hypothetical protein